MKNPFKLAFGQFDIETVFLYGELEEALWMEFPQGYFEFLREVYHIDYDSAIYCLKLLKAMYGLVQAARQWRKRFKAVMPNLDFQPSKADPCLFIIATDDHEVKTFIIIYVDDE
jgi:hypothetical protein